MSTTIPPRTVIARARLFTGDEIDMEARDVPRALEIAAEIVTLQNRNGVQAAIQTQMDALRKLIADPAVVAAEEAGAADAAERAFRRFMEDTGGDGSYRYTDVDTGLPGVLCPVGVMQVQFVQAIVEIDAEDETATPEDHAQRHSEIATKARELSQEPEAAVDYRAVP